MMWAPSALPSRAHRCGQALLALGLAIQGVRMLGYRVVVTPSIPRGIYTTSKLEGMPAKGAYVCVETRSSDAPDGLRSRSTGFATLLKRVAAVEGDVITQSNDGSLSINGSLLPQSRGRAVDSQGHALSHPIYPIVLKRDEAWLTSEHSNGFDSRYFGPVDRSILSCVGEPAWIW